MSVAFVAAIGSKLLPRDALNYPSQIQYIVNDKRKPSDNPRNVIYSDNDEQHNQQLANK